MSKSNKRIHDWVKFDHKTKSYRKVVRRHTEERDAELEIQEAKNSLTAPYNFRFN